MEFGLLGGPTWWFLAGLLGFLVLATVVAEMMYRRTASEGLRATLLNVRQRIFAWWIMVAVLVGSLALGETAVVLLFLALSLLALREFANLLPPGERDRRVLSWIMVVLAPLHFWFVWEHWYGMFAIFIPVYAFLFLPVLLALSGRTESFLHRAALSQWGLMVCVYALSYLPAVLQLPVAIHEGRAAADGSAVGSGGVEAGALLLFLAVVVQGSDVLQYLWGKTVGRHRIAPTVSPNKTWEGFVGGVLSATALGAALWWLTPFTPWQAGVLALVSCLLGFLGGLVMSSLKRDRGIKDFGALIPGHGGILDRMDSLIFAAPVFFHLTRFFFAG
ncbi:phosphatidate cytidylyltransferase [Kocuria rhizophila]|uniref:phosphatidate cytidylyltransferase n=1 Tax=Kocuria rhizophila TaxID=72000 RepID=UPI000C87C357|nr:phosphatidate cytidylyltransferase [Kocuria rhizophila]MBO4144761.1 phosphatidate cytidylyltransferase [Kocuria rhizophila]MCT1956850.1 phosphatidate cytidylyltransferase [Kocuria rhizophila]MCT2073473.1 phosphatidate cytidylyltransferase [Kocuria rhizophila]PMR90676.1 phosphatidate cytidylyltransferase [Kocuria rhizophila]QTK31455.1 phosphatidate cytidylyltransferase [Kocuria rhizophila]